MKCNAMEPGEFKVDLSVILCSRGGLLKRIGRAQVSFKVADIHEEGPRRRLDSLGRKR